MARLNSTASCPGDRVPTHGGRCGCKIGSEPEAVGRCNLRKMGHSKPFAGDASCEPCREGHHQPIEGQADCTPCRVGTHQPDQGAVECRRCPTA
eukprot:1573686-Prymnesium_polylepis.1